MAIELLSLRYFMAAAEQRSFTKAARLTYTSQSNISKQISRLEEEMGVPLFDRTAQGIGLTPAGQTLYDGLGDLLPALDALIDRAQKTHAESQRPTLTVGLAEGLDIEQVIPGFFAAVYAAFPGLDLRMQAHPFDRLAERLAREELDCAFLYSVVELDERVRRIPLTRKNPLLYFSGGHPLAAKADLTVMDFRGETFISSGRYGSYDEFEMLPFRPARVIEANSLQAVFQYVSAGVGVAVLGQSQANRARASIRAIELPTERKVGADLVFLRAARGPTLEAFTALVERLPKA